jgi:hypothetical protein
MNRLRYTRSLRDGDDDDAGSFYSSPTDGYFRDANPRGRESVPSDVMYINTEAANQAAKRPQVTIGSPAQERSPLLETFVGQDAPPSYLEATTPMGWRGEGVGLLNEDRAMLTPLREEGYRDGRYRRRNWRDISWRKRLQWSAVMLVIMILIVIIAVLATRNEKVRELGMTTGDQC